MNQSPSLHLPPLHLKVALLQPQIAPNTGNIARLCVATGLELHLVRPMGFILNDRELRRSAMDYWPRLRLKVHDDTESFLSFVAESSSPGHPSQTWLFSTKGNVGLWDARINSHDWLVFGSETQGISESLLAAAADRSVRIPQAPGERCLNLSTAVGIGVYEAIRQTRNSQGNTGIS